MTEQTPPPPPPTEARAQIDRIMADPKHGYWDGDPAARDQVEALYKAADSRPPEAAQAGAEEPSPASAAAPDGPENPLARAMQDAVTVPAADGGYVAFDRVGDLGQAENPAEMIGQLQTFLGPMLREAQANDADLAVLVETYNEVLRVPAAKRETMDDRWRTEADSYLAQTYGTEAPQRVAMLREFLRQAGGDDVFAAIRAAGLGNHPGFLRRVDALLTRFLEQGEGGR